MDDPSFSGEPPAFPAPPPEPFEELFAKAEAARHRQVWEEAMRLYRAALLKEPSHKGALAGLAQAYDGKSREPGYESYFQSAVGEYRKIVLLDPTDAKAHDALLAAAIRADGLGELLDDYKKLSSGGPHAQVFKDAIRKIQTLLLLKTTNVKKGPPPLPAFLNTLMGIGAPAAALVCLIAAIIVRLKGQTETSAVITLALLKASFGSFVAFIGFKIFLYLRAR